MQPEISPLDPADQPTVDAIQQLRVAVEAVTVPDFPPPCPVEFRASLTHQVSFHRTERYVARLDGVPAGYLTIGLPQRENLENASVGLAVHPDHRRRGAGRALHAYLLQRLAELGRKRYYSDTVASLPGGPERLVAGAEFATAMGAAMALPEVRRRLDLTTVPEQVWRELGESARPAAAGYQVVTWRDRTPDEFAADAGYLDGRLISDAPTGDLVWDAAAVDVSRLREKEGMLAAYQLRTYSAGAVHEQSGRLVALTTIGRQHNAPWHAWQWITLVDPEHRGHRLGALVKVANLQFALAHEPQLRVVDTWNAAVNEHMISINEAMGFRPVDRWVSWQQEV